MGQSTLLHCGILCGGGVREGTMPLAQHSPHFQSLPPLPTSKLGPGADSWVGGFVYILGPCGSLQGTLLGGWEFLPLPQPPQVFSVRGLRLYFPTLEPWVEGLSRSPVVPPGLSAHECGTVGSTSHCLASSPLCPAAHLCPSYRSG